MILFILLYKVILSWLRGRLFYSLTLNCTNNQWAVISKWYCLNIMLYKVIWTFENCELSPKMWPFTRKLFSRYFDGAVCFSLSYKAKSGRFLSSDSGRRLLSHKHVPKQELPTFLNLRVANFQTPINLMIDKRLDFERSHFVRFVNSHSTLSTREFLLVKW